MQVERELDLFWHNSGRRSIKSKLNRLVSRAGVDTTIDATMYTTMSLEKIIDYPGGELYEIMMLKPKSWNVIGATSFSATYWKSWVLGYWVFVDGTIWWFKA